MIQKSLVSCALILAISTGSAQAAAMVPDFKPMDNWLPYMGEEPFSEKNSLFG